MFDLGWVILREPTTGSVRNLSRLTVTSLLAVRNVLCCIQHG